MKTSLEGKIALAASEGIVPAVYKDSRGIDTWGIGVTHWAIGDEEFSRLNVNMPADMDKAIKLSIELFEHVLVKYEKAVVEAVKVPLEQHEFDALVHFTYNIGGPNFRRSRLLRLLNAGQREEAGKTGFHGWLKPIELLSRRDFESELFLHGNYGTKPIPVYGTNGAKRRLGRVRVIGRDELRNLLLPTPTASISRPTGHATAPRERVEQTQTAFLANVQKWVGAGGTISLGGLASLRDLDPAVQFALIGVVAIGFIGVFWLLSKLIFREREKHFNAGVK